MLSNMNGHRSCGDNATWKSEVSKKELVKTFLIWRDEIRHPDPEYAVSYGILTVAFALRELILFDQACTFEHALPVRDDQLKAELPRMFLRYLGIATN